MTTHSYDTDFYTWTQQQAAALRPRDWRGCGTPGGGDRELGERASARRGKSSGDRADAPPEMGVPARAARSWLADQRPRRPAADRPTPAAQPGLRPDLPTFLADAYADARKRAMDDTGFPLDTFPEACPWTIAQVLDEDFWPEA